MVSETKRRVRGEQTSKLNSMASGGKESERNEDALNKGTSLFSTENLI
jgi:hypothetical protein